MLSGLGSSSSGDPPPFPEGVAGAVAGLDVDALRLTLGDPLALRAEPRGLGGRTGLTSSGVGGTVSGGASRSSYSDANASPSGSDLTSTIARDDRPARATTGRAVRRSEPPHNRLADVLRPCRASDDVCARGFDDERLWRSDGRSHAVRSRPAQSVQAADSRGSPNSHADKPTRAARDAKRRAPSRARGAQKTTWSSR